MEKDQKINTENETTDEKKVVSEDFDKGVEKDISKEVEETKEILPEEKIIELEDKLARTFAEMENQRRKIGFVFQDFKLLKDRSVYENMKFVLEATGWNDQNKIDTQIKKVFELAGIIIPLDKFPHELSGGEQQRVAIARSLLNDPELIIADEPTGNLDPETSSEIISLFQKLNKMGTSMIIATHDYNLILKLEGQVYKCEDGSIFEVKRK